MALAAGIPAGKLIVNIYISIAAGIPAAIQFNYIYKPCRGNPHPNQLPCAGGIPPSANNYFFAYTNTLI